MGREKWRNISAALKIFSSTKHREKYKNSYYLCIGAGVPL